MSAVFLYAVAVLGFLAGLAVLSVTAIYIREDIRERDKVGVLLLSFVGMMGLALLAWSVYGLTNIYAWTS